MSYYQYPQPAFLGKRLTKEMLYDRLEFTPELKRLFIDQIEKIEWRYKVGESTINLESNDDFVEFQVFQITLKNSVLDDAILKAIDALILYPIIFEILSDEGVYIAATYKRKHELKQKMVIDKAYFKSPMFPLESERQPLPPAISLKALYEAILKTLLPLEADKTKDLPIEELLERIDKQKQIEKEIVKLQKQISIEKQFKKKIEKNRILKELQKALREL